jgi:cytochrome c biogenesis protein CcmG, thiol:disulfide interchange protein DsbE
MITRTFWLPLTVFAALVVVLAIGISRSDKKSVVVSPLIGRPAPEFMLPDLLQPGRSVNSASLRGRHYLLNVWGTWCAACRQEHEMLLAIQKSGKISVVGLNWKDNDAAAQQWLTQLGNPYEMVAVDREGRTAIDWGVYGAPETFLINAAGIVVYKYVGPLTMDVWQTEILPRLNLQSTL